MRKLVIAEHNETLSDCLEKALCKEWDIRICADGYAALDAMRYLSPEAMILDLSLPPVDGLAVLEESFPDVPPVTLGLTNYISPYVQTHAESLGVGFVVRIPCSIKYVKDRLDDMYNTHFAPAGALPYHFRVLGVNPKYDGYRYLLTAVALFSKDKSQNLHKEIYAAVARTCGAGSADCVERSIRTAVHAAWQSRNIAIWSQYFPLNNNGDVSHPSNGEFIGALAERI